ncbi:MAG TPA: CBS domain-containing protein [Nocardioidaceae bacterium]|nr:CBS domain-containing protein [Nocardioidaceae bacterium]
MKISDVIKDKPTQEVVTINPSSTVRELVALLAQHNVGALVVSTDGSSVDGIVSERDVVRRLNDDASLLSAKVSDIMTVEVFTVEPTLYIDDLMRLMTKHRIRHVPVVVDGALKGIVSIGDVVKNRMGELEFERDQLDKFVHSQQT